VRAFAQAGREAEQIGNIQGRIERLEGEVSKINRNLNAVGPEHEQQLRNLSAKIVKLNSQVAALREAVVTSTDRLKETLGEFADTHGQELALKIQRDEEERILARRIDEAARGGGSGGGGAGSGRGGRPAALLAMHAAMLALVLLGSGSMAEKAKILAGSYAVNKVIGAAATSLAGAELAGVLGTATGFLITLCGDRAGACEEQEQREAQQEMMDEIEACTRGIMLYGVLAGEQPELPFAYQQAVHEAYVKLGLPPLPESRSSVNVACRKDDPPIGISPFLNSRVISNAPTLSPR